MLKKIKQNKIDWDNPQEVQEYNKEYRENNKNRIIANNNKYRKFNKEKMKAASKKYCKNNKDKIQIKDKKYYENHKEKILMKNKKYAEENRDKIVIKKKEYYKNNKDGLKIKGKKWEEKNKERIQIQKKEYYLRNKEEKAKYNKKYNERNKKAKCIVCGKPAPIKYCSKECGSIYRRGENHHFWKGGVSNNPYPITWTERLRRKIRKRDAYLCMMCGRHQDEFNRSHDVHHIDGDKDNCDKENLITLCRRHHGIVEHGGKKYTFWMPKFQKMLFKIYSYKYR